jgi:hypothetical protein
MTHEAARGFLTALIRTVDQGSWADAVAMLLRHGEELRAWAVASERDAVWRKIVECFGPEVPLQSGNALDQFLTWYDARRQ